MLKHGCGNKLALDLTLRSARKHNPSQGKITLQNIQFSYPTRKKTSVYDQLSLTIPARKTVALVGGSGSGKSTIVQLVERFYDPVKFWEDSNGVADYQTAGTVMLDGVDIKTLDVMWMRSQIGMVGQEPVLFNKTVFENVAMGASKPEEVTKEEVVEACKHANAHDFIMSLDRGYSSVCGDGGSLLSGGQKQRVAIARAIVGKPKILILDEATSALDNESERIVQRALDNLISERQEQGGRTTIIIAHRLSTVKNADIIFMLKNDGKGNGSKLVESGSHDTLLANNGAYKALWDVAHQ